MAACFRPTLRHGLHPPHAARPAAAPPSRVPQQAMSTATAVPELHRRRPFLLRIHAGKSNPGRRRRLPEHRFSCPLPPVSLFGPASRRPWRAALPLGCKQRETVRGREEGQSALVPPRRGRTTRGPPSPHRRGAGEELPERREPRPGLLCLGEGGGERPGAGAGVGIS